MNPSANTVEVHLPQAGISKMVWAISLFSLTGLIASLVALGELSNPWRGFPKEPLIFAFLACLLFVFGVAGLLVWQLARLVGAYKESVRHTIKRAQFESLAQPPQTPPAYIQSYGLRLGNREQESAPPPQSQPVYIPASNVSSPSVVEHTTRQMAGRYKEPIDRE